MRILILNWRCPTNPKAGGAELLTYEVARRLVAQGDTVEWFSASFPGSLPREIVAGIQVVRAGTQSSVHVHAYFRYRRELSKHFDVVIDEVNTMPFFTPLWSDVPTFMLINQLAREVWWYESRFPLNVAGYVLEPVYLRVYRRAPVFTISNSTRDDLRRLRFTGPVTILPMGIEPIDLPPIAKREQPTLLYVGRLAPSKRIGKVLEAFRQFRAAVGDGDLWLVGEGEPSYVRSLHKKSARLGLADHVRFLGRISAREKYEAMSAAHLLLMASVREGWGLVVSEANACGTPAVVYNVRGLRDAVVNGKTGLVVEPRPDALANGAVRLWEDKAFYETMAREAKRSSARLSFDETASAVREEILRVMASEAVAV